MKKLQFILLALASATISSHAATSFLLIQGNFGASGAFTSLEWQVNYNTGGLLTDQDLLNSVLGTPTDSHTQTSGGKEIYNSGNSTTGAQYYLDPTYGLFLISFTLLGTTLAPNYNIDSSYWTLSVAGGAGAYGSDGFGAAYPSGSWSYSNDGSASRTLANGSYDAWYITGGSNPTNVTGVNPTTTDFANATVVSAPEPTSLALLGGAFAAGLIRRKRIA
ncbi:MAG: PEP-CTERM sorting domain-containing protein [Chthoniobacteraceae bacterium]